jgi:hypothetical protein
MLAFKSRNLVINNFRKAVNIIAPKPEAEYLEPVKESPNLAYQSWLAILQGAHNYKAQNAQAQA